MGERCGRTPAERFPRFRRRLTRRLATLERVPRQQVALLRRYRGTNDPVLREELLAAVLGSIS